MNTLPTWNRAERRRRGMTRSRMKRTGSIASAGVLVSAGLFGAYVGNPRLQRAYASPPVCSGAVTVTGPLDDTLVAALDDSTVTCIEIQGRITLTADLPITDDDYWTGGPRDSSLGLTLYGVGGDDTIDGDGIHAGLAILLDDTPVDTVSLNLSGLTMTNLESASGGAVSIGVRYGAAALSVCGSNFADNIAESGGAIFASSVSPGTLRINDPGCSSGPTTFARNTATGSDGGGAIFTGLDADIYDAHFTGNTATYDGLGLSANGVGGAIAGANSFDDTLSVRVFESTFTDDTSAGDGGAISLQGRVDVSGVTFAGNRSDGNGGAIAGRFVYADNGTEFLHNSANDGGGAVFCYVDTSDCRVDVSGVTFEENWSHSGGGAIAGQFVYADNGTQFLDNSAGDEGGAITAYRVGLDGVLIEGNGAFTGGGVHVTQDLSTVSNSTIYDNTAWDRGGGIYVGDSVTVSYSAIIGNRAVDDTYADATGGGIAAFSNSEVLLTNSYIGGNQADDTAGGIYFRPGSQSHLGLYFTTMYDDTVTRGGGHAAFDVHSLTAVGSAVGNEWSNNVWSATFVDDTYFVSTDQSSGAWIPRSGSVELGPGVGLGLGVRDDTVTPGHAGSTPLAGSPLITGAPSSFFGVLPAGDDQLGVSRVSPYTIGARQFVAPAPPPGPSGVVPSAPRDPRGVAGDRQAVVSWVEPADSGSFPITDYEVTSVPSGGSCLVKVPSLSCTVSGLDNGTSYVFRVRALNGAGWSAESVASNGVMPRPGPSILVTGTRDGNRVRVRGATQGLTASTVVPRYHFAGEVDYTTGVARPRIDATGEFTWSRIAGRTIYVYFAADGTRSNRLVLKREG